MDLRKDAPFFLPVLVAVLSLGELLRGAQAPNLCGGCHTVPFIALGALGAALGVIGALLASKKTTG